MREHGGLHQTDDPLPMETPEGDGNSWSTGEGRGAGGNNTGPSDPQHWRSQQKTCEATVRFYCLLNQIRKRVVGESRYICIIYVNYMYTICIIYEWYMYNICIIYVWYMYNICMIYVWYMYDICKLYVNYMYNICMIYV